MRKLLNVLRGRRRRMERDLDRELRFHVDRRVEDLMRSGLSESDARQQAGAEFGGRAQVQEDVRDTWIWRWLTDRGRDVRFAARALMRRPVFTITAVLSLTIGIGVSAAIFSLADQLLFRSLPVRDPDRLVLINWNGSALAPSYGSDNFASYPLCRELQQQTSFFDGVLCRHPATVYLSSGDRAEPVGADIVSGSYFDVLGVAPALGRMFTPDDDQVRGAHAVVVISHEYWLTRLNGAADAIGRTVRVNNVPMTVIGVAPATFHGVDVGAVPAVWIPAMMHREALPWFGQDMLGRRVRWMHILGRLAPGVTRETATTGLQPWFKQMLESDTRHESFPQVSEQRRNEFLASTIELMPASGGRSDLRNTMHRPLWVLLAATALLHLLASLNVAGLFLARGAGRGREIHTRLALGASRSRVVGLLVTDGLLVSAAGAIAGLALAPVVSNVLLSFLPRNVAGIDIAASVDLRVIGFAVLASIVTSLFCGFALAWQSGRLPLIASLRERGGAAGNARLRKALVISQLALTLILLVGSGLFAQTLARLQATGPGFETTRLLMFGVSPTGSGYNSQESRRILHTLFETMRSLPEVESASAIGLSLLGGGSFNSNFTIEAADRMTTDRPADFNVVTPGFFGTTGVTFLAGRDFDDRDVSALDAPTLRKTAIVNERFARRYFGDASPIGRRIGMGTRPDTVTDVEIVGVVKDFAYGTIRGASEQVFFSLFEDTYAMSNGTFYLRVHGAPEAAFSAVRAAIARVDPTLPLLNLRTFDEQVARSLTTERMLATLSTGFGAIALLLSVVGLYGVLSFVVTSRTREIGIRLALGATRSSALWHVVRDALVMIAIGTAIALPCVWALGRYVEAQLFGVTAIDLPTILLASAVLALSALTGTMIPAWRAASVKPTEALRAE